MKINEAKAIVKGLSYQRDEATDAVASMTTDLYPAMKYDGSLITAGMRINWNGVLKRAAVDLWDTAENTPDAASNLWEDISYYMGYRIIPEVITATLAFSEGEIGYWQEDGKFYRALMNATWTPGAYPAAWEEVSM